MIRQKHKVHVDLCTYLTTYHLVAPMVSAKEKLVFLVTLQASAFPVYVQPVVFVKIRATQTQHSRLDGSANKVLQTAFAYQECARHSRIRSLLRCLYGIN